LGQSIEPELRRMVRQTKNAEAKERMERLARALNEGRLQRERAIEVLEMMDTPEAIKLLTELAGGLPGVSLTADAAGALSRVRR
jgi:hypothetical protein